MTDNEKTRAVLLSILAGRYATEDNTVLLTMLRDAGLGKEAIIVAQLSSACSNFSKACGEQAMRLLGL